MSHRINTLSQIRDNLQEVMMTCWREGRKLIESDPTNSETYFVIGETCMGLISKIQEDINSELHSFLNNN